MENALKGNTREIISMHYDDLVLEERMEKREMAKDLALKPNEKQNKRFQFAVSPVKMRDVRPVEREQAGQDEAAILLGDVKVKEDERVDWGEQIANLKDPLISRQMNKSGQSEQKQVGTA